MGSSGSVLGKKRLNMNLHYFALFLLLVLTVNGAPKPDPKASPKAAPKASPKAAPKPNPEPKAKPNPKADPKAKAQMAIIFNNKNHGNTGIKPECGEYGGNYEECGEYASDVYGYDYGEGYGYGYADDGMEWSQSFGKK